jgi:hypothetical protein
MTSRRYEVKYAEAEAAHILERAAELQRLSSDPSRMTIAELEDAAASAGIAPVHVRRAAGELALRQARRDRNSPGLGGPRSILIEVTLDGEIPVRAYEYVIEAIRRHTGELGVASLIGRSLTWMAHPSHNQANRARSRTIALTIVPRAGRTRIRIEEKLDLLVRGVFGGLVGGLGAGGAASLVPLMMLGVPGLVIPLGMGAWVATTWTLSRRVYRNRVAAREHELHGALQAILDIAEESMNVP